MGILALQSLFAIVSSMFCSSCCTTPPPPHVPVAAAAVASTSAIAAPEPAPLPAPAPAAMTGELRLLSQNVTYQLRQYTLNVAPSNPANPNADTPRLVDLPVSGAALNGPSPVYDPNTASRFRGSVVGWVFVTPPESDGTQMQRWLLLHEVQKATTVDFELSPASYMGGSFPAPTNLTDFTARANYIFDAAKLSSGDTPRDRTRYAKVRGFATVITDTATDFPPDTHWPSPPGYPTPTGNGLWDGGAGWQLDSGSAGIYLKGTTNGPVGWMAESNGGSAGTEKWMLKAGYTPPTGGNVIIIASPNYSTPAQQSAIGTPNGSDRNWNVVREAATYFQATFPVNDP